MMPTLDYEWTESGVDIVLKIQYMIYKEKNILAFFKGIEADGIGPGNIKRIMDAD